MLVPVRCKLSRGVSVQRSAVKPQPGPNTPIAQIRDEEALLSLLHTVQNGKKQHSFIIFFIDSKNFILNPSVLNRSLF